VTFGKFIVVRQCVSAINESLHRGTPTILFELKEYGIGTILGGFLHDSNFLRRPTITLVTGYPHQPFDLCGQVWL
jgi:hypothetical protein